MNDEVPGEGDFDAGRRRGEFDDITWRILAVLQHLVFFLVLQPPLESAFLVFPESRQPPKLVEYFGKVLPLCHDRPAGGICATQHADPDRFARHSGTHRLCRHHIAASVEAQHTAFDRPASPRCICC